MRGIQNWLEFEAETRERVLDLGRNLLMNVAVDDSTGLKLPELPCQSPGGLRYNRASATAYSEVRREATRDSLVSAGSYLRGRNVGAINAPQVPVDQAAIVEPGPLYIDDISEDAFPAATSRNGSTRAECPNRSGKSRHRAQVLEPNSRPMRAEAVGKPKPPAGALREVAAPKRKESSLQTERRAYRPCRQLRSVVGCFAT